MPEQDPLCVYVSEGGTWLPADPAERPTPSISTDPLAAAAPVTTVPR